MLEGLPDSGHEAPRHGFSQPWEKVSFTMNPHHGPLYSPWLAPTLDRNQQGESADVRCRNHQSSGRHDEGPATFKAQASEMSKIAERGKAAGAIHHRFAASESEIIVIDEWTTAKRSRGSSTTQRSRNLWQKQELRVRQQSSSSRLSTRPTPSKYTCHHDRSSDFGLGEPRSPQGLPLFFPPR